MITMIIMKNTVTKISTVPNSKLIANTYLISKVFILYCLEVMKKGSTPGREPRKILKRFTNHGLVVPCDVSILYKLVFNQKKIAELSFHEISRQNKINAQEN